MIVRQVGRGLFQSPPDIDVDLFDDLGVGNVAIDLG